MNRSQRRKRDNNSLLRRRSSRNPQPIIIIACEGEKTEAKYFTDCCRQYNLTRVSILGLGQDPSRLVKSAQDKKLEIERGKGRKDGEKVDPGNVWCVFDRDEHERIAEAIDQAKGNNFGLAYSLPSFELWLLLHYQDQTAHIERDKVLKELRKCIPNYEKGMEGVFGLTCGKLEEAHRRSENLRKKHKGDGNSEHSNPSSSVDLLMKHLAELSDKIKG